VIAVAAAFDCEDLGRRARSPPRSCASGAPRAVPSRHGAFSVELQPGRPEANGCASAERSRMLLIRFAALTLKLVAAAVVGVATVWCSSSSRSTTGCATSSRGRPTLSSRWPQSAFERGAARGRPSVCRHDGESGTARWSTSFDDWAQHQGGSR
jgi:hypothetical protein